MLEGSVDKIITWCDVKIQDCYWGLKQEKESASEMTIYVDMLISCTDY